MLSWRIMGGEFGLRIPSTPSEKGSHLLHLPFLEARTLPPQDSELVVRCQGLASQWGHPEQNIEANQPSPGPQLPTSQVTPEPPIHGSLK